MPACGTACPTQSIQFGDLDELQERADKRLATLNAQGVESARLYGRDENDGAGGDGAFFLLLDEPGRGDGGGGLAASRRRPVFKPTSPLSVGSYILSPFSAAAGRLRRWSCWARLRCPAILARNR